MRRQGSGGGEAGFSLIELMVAMAVTLIIMTLASTVLMECFNIRSRQDSRTAALADVQRALNIIARETASAGYGLSTNGIVGCSGAAASTCDSGDNSIRVRSNLNRFNSSPTDTDTTDDGEDVKFFIQTTNGKRYVVRYNHNAASNQATVLANRIDQLQFYYYDERVNYATGTYSAAAPDAALITNVRNGAGAAESEVTPDKAKYVVIVIVVNLEAVGTRGTDGYQPETQEMLVSDVALRNNDLSNY
ncbi:MAG TPA: prepilin-type N-terminal cleavage/methylation domain-containing protein [Pyrinomonadaceae bacterium]|jgi:prepilin-type N-terminal cleavage/methylation domain-containing protein